MSEKIAYLGPIGTFSEFAAKTIFPNEHLVPYKTIPNCIDALIENEVTYSVVPLENAIEGSVNLTIDYLFHEHKLPIVAEIVVPIKQHLMVHPRFADDWKAVTAIYSHPQAISQCHHFIKNQFEDVELHYTNSTAAAAKFIFEQKDKPYAAIGNQLAAEKYGLSIVQHDIHDFQSNHTKFVVLSQTHEPLIKDNLCSGDKTTFVIKLPSDYPGALHQVLSAFAWRKLNLSKIESRPLKTGLGNYYFIIDVEMKADDVLVPGVKSELEALGCEVDIVGSYPCYVVK